MYVELQNNFKTAGRQSTKQDMPELSQEEMQAITGGLQLTTEARTRQIASYKKKQVCSDVDCSDGCCTV